jgi:hypothetical protein
MEFSYFRITSVFTNVKPLRGLMEAIFVLLEQHIYRNINSQKNRNFTGAQYLIYLDEKSISGKNWYLNSAELLLYYFSNSVTSGWCANIILETACRVSCRTVISIPTKSNRTFSGKKSFISFSKRFLSRSAPSKWQYQSSATDSLGRFIKFRRWCFCILICNW